jgi:predicted DNA-binding transcriptional regulator AlpA
MSRNPGSAVSPEPASRSDLSAAAPRQPDRFTLRLEEVAGAFGVSRRTIERERSAGRFPRPDILIGKIPLWRPRTVEAWIEERSRRPRGRGGAR